MTEFLKTWVINIVVVIFFIAFIEILLPTSNMKRYINMVLGLLIIIVLINPIIKLMSSEINIEREVFLNIKNYNSLKTDNSSEYIKSQNRQITEVYKKKLEKEIVELVKKEEDFNSIKVSVSIEENIESDDFGKITGIQVYLGVNNDKSNDKYNIKIDEIEKIAINTGKSSLSSSNKVSLPGFESIIESISSFYKVPKDKIIVILKT